MLFFPYKLDIALFRLPLLTILACLICIATFASQVRSSAAFDRNMTAFCGSFGDVNLRAMLDNIDDATLGKGCESIFTGLRQSADRDRKIAQLAQEVRGLDFYRDRSRDLSYKEDSLRGGLADFEAFVPKELTDSLAYRPDRYDVVTMVTSTFAHASFSHLFGNLVFFYIFASCVESALGGLHFIGAFLLMAVVTSLAYSHSVAAADALPAVGLSGVAMGMMALLTTMLPKARIWCFFWFLLFVRRFTLPVLVIAAWQIGWNLYELNHHDAASHINYIAHVSGAATGVALGIAYRLFASQRLETLEMGMGVT
jgi:membrane associated rhomboid family serine protease